jgi:hypothetical protein
MKGQLVRDACLRGGAKTDQYSGEPCTTPHPRPDQEPSCSQEACSGSNVGAAGSVQLAPSQNRKREAGSLGSGYHPAIGLARAFMDGDASQPLYVSKAPR